MSFASIIFYYISIFSLSQYHNSPYYGSFEKEIESRDYYLSVFGYVICILLIDYGTSRLIDLIRSHDNSTHEKGETLNEETRLDEDQKELLEPIPMTKSHVNFCTLILI